MILAAIMVVIELVLIKIRPNLVLFSNGNNGNQGCSFKPCVNHLIYSIFLFLANTLILDSILGNVHFHQRSYWWMEDR